MNLRERKNVINEARVNYGQISQTLLQALAHKRKMRSPFLRTSKQVSDKNDNSSIDDLGDLVYEPPRSGPTIWEIGVPNRTAMEFYVPDPTPKYLNKLYVNHPENRCMSRGEGHKNEREKASYPKWKIWPNSVVGEDRVVTKRITVLRKGCEGTWRNWKATTTFGNQRHRCLIEVHSSLKLAAIIFKHSLHQIVEIPQLLQGMMNKSSLQTF
eukprot:Gb_20602 [translate_table: standard]